MKSVSVPIAAMALVGAAVFADGVNPGVVCAEEEVECLCPDFYTWNVEVPIRVEDPQSGTLELRFLAYAMHTLDYNKQKGLYWAWFNPRQRPEPSYEPVGINDGHRIWYADGAWKGSCRCIGNIDIVRPFLPPGNFDGNTWYEDHPIEDPISDPNPPTCDWEPCDDGSGSGGTGGGDTGIDHSFRTYYFYWDYVCTFTDWYVCVDGSCRYQYTQISDCGWESA